jgi:hypothetical protein
VRPEPSYGFVYPSYVNLDRIAYFFEYTMGNVVPDEALYETDDWIREWCLRWHSGVTAESLVYRKISDSILIDDRRGRVKPMRYVFDGPLGEIYTYCSENARSIADVTAWLVTAVGGRSFSEHEVKGALEEFCRAGLAIGENDLYLSLALPANPNW